MLQSAMLPTSTAKSSRTLKRDNHCHKTPRLVTLRKLSRTRRMRSKGLYQQGRTRGRLIDKVAGRGIDLQPSISPGEAAGTRCFCSLKVGVESQDKQSDGDYGKKQPPLPTAEPKRRCTPLCKEIQIQVRQLPPS